MVSGALVSGCQDNGHPERSVLNHSLGLGLERRQGWLETVAVFKPRPCHCGSSDRDLTVRSGPTFGFHLNPPNPPRWILLRLAPGCRVIGGWGFQLKPEPEPEPGDLAHYC